MFSQITMLDFSKAPAQRLASRKHCGPYKWSPRDPKLSDGIGFYSGRTVYRMDDHGSVLDLRIDLANNLLPYSRLTQINGYYCDDNCDQTMVPIVARLPRGRGFLAGWTMGAGMCASLSTVIYTDAGDAARAAHNDAEYAADMEREYQAQHDNDD